MSSSVAGAPTCASTAGRRVAVGAVMFTLLVLRFREALD
jgi:hypothetical protein